MGIVLGDHPLQIPQHIYERDAMELAVKVSRQCRQEPGKLTPTPNAGAVVMKNGVILESAFRGEFDSREHAEFTLLERKLPEVDLSGATIFTTLEPCTIRGKDKTACAQRIIDRGISHVLIGMLDPNPDVCGLGQIMLRKAKIKVTLFEHDLMDEVEIINKTFSDQYPLEERLASLARARAVGPNGFRTGFDNEGNLVEWIQEEDDPEPLPMILRRSDSIISAEYQELWDKVWWNRHKYWEHQIRTGVVKLDSAQEVVYEQARRAAQRIEETYGEENLGWDDVEWGILQGKLSALAWVMGSEWEGSMDT